ncbi:hypothetical protein UPYG_G00042060 [Umbra pygmaea]|uniref:Uncharacterized protein n=1 Tax=Umbra pygmaea TaxID=75934 RepID=A0ABD0XQ96_UMBPY
MRLTSFQCWPEADNSSDFGGEEVNKLFSHFRLLLLFARVDVELILTNGQFSRLNCTLQDSAKKPLKRPGLL